MTTAPRAASISAVAALVLAAVWLFWPAALGGGTTYVSTHGISMEPGFQTGDLALLRPADAYSVGDVVAYRSESLDTIVMHRIVSGDADGFVTQGDNNDWLDEDRPAADAMLGALVVRIPQGGTALAALRSPGSLAVVAVAATLVFGVLRRPPRRAVRSRRGRMAGRPPITFSMPVRARARQVVLGSAVVALLAGGACGVLAVMPGTQTETRSVDVAQQGRFSYSGTAAPGTTYPSGVIATGDTVWTRLAEGLTVSFTNTVSGPGLADVRGTMRLDVSVTAPDGWSSTLASSPVVPLEGGTATAEVAVDAEAALELLNRHYAETGTAGGQATIAIAPVAETTGTVRGRSFTAESPAAMAFTLDAASLRPVGDVTTDLAPTVRTSVQVREVVARSLPVLALSVPIDVARIAAAGVLVVALVALGAGAWIGRSVRGSVADRFVLRYADRIVPVAAYTAGPSVIDVSDAESLHRVAERFDTVVLHHAGSREDVFVVRDADATYRFVVPGTPERQRGKPPVPARLRPPAPTPASVPPPLPAWERAALTLPMPIVLPAPVPVAAASAAGGPWGRFA